MLYLFLEKKMLSFRVERWYHITPNHHWLWKRVKTFDSDIYIQTVNMLLIQFSLIRTCAYMSPCIDNVSFLLYILFSQWLTHMCTGQTTQDHHVYNQKHVYTYDTLHGQTTHGGRHRLMQKKKGSLVDFRNSSVKLSRWCIWGWLVREEHLTGQFEGTGQRSSHWILLLLTAQSGSAVG